MTTATEQLIARDNDLRAARMTASQIVSLLRDFIPEQYYRDAYERVLEAAHKEGWELTSAAMRKEYESWREQALQIAMLTPHAPKG